MEAAENPHLLLHSNNNNGLDSYGTFLLTHTQSAYIALLVLSVVDFLVMEELTRR